MAVVTAFFSWAHPGELGTRLSWDGDLTGSAWLSLSGELGGLAWTARGEADLFPVRFRLLTGGLRYRGDGLSLSGEAKLLGSGRLDLSAKGELSSSTAFDEWKAEGRAGARATWAAAFSGGHPSLAGWAVGRLDAGALWGEGRVDVSAQGGLPRMQISCGTSGVGWATLRLSTLGLALGSVGLELGAAEAGLSATSYLSLFPNPTATITVRQGGEGVQLQGRLTVAAGRWAWAASVSGELGSLRLKLAANFSREGLKKLALEARLPVGD